jgi:type II secretory pathway component GspD/PulD (secretin)
MNVHRRFQTLVVAVLACLGIVSLGAIVRAQSSGGVTPPRLTRATFQNADIREALRHVLGQTQLTYTIAPEVQGAITIESFSGSVDQFLRLALPQVGATYRVEGSVYNIVAKPLEHELLAELKQTVPDQTSAPTIIRDGYNLYIIRGNLLQKVNLPSMKLESTLDLNTGVVR